MKSSFLSEASGLDRGPVQGGSVEAPVLLPLWRNWRMYWRLSARYYSKEYICNREKH